MENEWTREIDRLKAENKTLIVMAKGALAALSQNKTYQVDIDLAKSFLTDTLSALKKLPGMESRDFRVME